MLDKLEKVEERFENVNEIKNAYHFAKAVLDFYSQK